MKRISSILLSIAIILSTISFCATSINEETLETLYFDDGSYVVTTIKAVYSVFTMKGSLTKTKQSKYYDPNDNLDWIASITGSFTYNGVTSSCTDVSKSTTIYDTAWRCTAASCSKSGATATGNFTFKNYVLGVPIQTVNKTLTLTCDKNGNIT